MNAPSLSFIAIVIFVSWFFYRESYKASWTLRSLGYTQLVLITMLSPEWFALSFCLWFTWKCFADVRDFGTHGMTSYFDETTVRQFAQGLAIFILLFLAHKNANNESSLALFTLALVLTSQIELDSKKQWQQLLAILSFAIISSIIQGSRLNYNNFGNLEALFTFELSWIRWLGQIFSGLLIVFLLQKIRFIRICEIFIKLIKILSTLTMLIPRKTVIVLGIISFLTGLYLRPFFYLSAWLWFSFFLHSYLFTNLAVNLVHHSKMLRLIFSSLLVATFLTTTFWKISTGPHQQNLSWMVWGMVLCLFTYFLNLYWRNSRDVNVPHLV